MNFILISPESLLAKYARNKGWRVQHSGRTHRQTHSFMALAFKNLFIDGSKAIPYGRDVTVGLGIA
jgi:hypothetical protein